MLLHINIYKAHKDPGKAQFCFSSANVSNSAPLSYEALGRRDLVEDKRYLGERMGALLLLYELLFIDVVLLFSRIQSQGLFPRSQEKV